MSAVSVFTAEEIKSLRNSCKDLRTRSLLEVVLATGARINEIERLNISDVDFDNSVITIPDTVHYSRRSIPIDPEYISFIDAYVTIRTDDEPELFMSRGCRMSCMGLRNLLFQLESETGIHHIALRSRLSFMHNARCL